MKLREDYSDIMSKQSEEIKMLFDGKKSAVSGAALFSKICRFLTKDFLPPIEREDIAALSYSLYEISVNAEEFDKSIAVEKLKTQITALKPIACGVIKKGNACEEEIRRQIDINFECAKIVSGNKCAEKLNDSLMNFWKTAQNTFFKNL